MRCALLFTESNNTAAVFRSVAADFGCITKHLSFGEEPDELDYDIPFSAVFADVGGMPAEEAAKRLADIATRFKSGCFYQLAAEGGQYAFHPGYSFLGVPARESFGKAFSECFSDAGKNPANIFRALRICNDCLVTEDVFSDRILLAVYPVAPANATEEILSALPLEILPETTVCFTDGVVVYAFVKCDLKQIYKISQKTLSKLKTENLRADIFFSDKLSSFEEACSVFSDLNVYAARCRLGKSKMDISYYNSTMRVLEPFGYMIRKAQITGNKIRGTADTEEIGRLVSDFLEQIQINSSLRTNMQFLICEMLRSAFDDVTVRDILLDIIGCTNKLEINKLIMGLVNREKREHNNYSVTSKDKIVLDILEIIDKEYATDLSLVKIAERVYLSPAYISKIFKKSQNVGFIKYLNNVRLEKATEFLKVNDYSVKEIGKLVGFRDNSYFCSCFKNKYGMSAAQYRRMYLPEKQ